MKYINFKENKTHGTFDFPIEFYHICENDLRYNMPHHWHKEFEIIRIIQGEFSLIINQEKIIAKKDDIIFIQEGFLHGGIPKNCIYECIVFDIQMLIKNNNACFKKIQEILDRKKVIMTNISFCSEIKFHTDNLFFYMKTKKIGYELISQGAIFSIFGIILEKTLYKEYSICINKTPQKLIQFKKILIYIENNYQNQISLEDLSNILGFNPKYFCKFFYEMSNKTPVQYINYYRIECACFMLISTDFSITEICINCGFNDLSYFIKYFKKIKGISPKQFKKLNTIKQI